jgi:pimeloyl-ACP methyl ester carboxylesterase
MGNNKKRPADYKPLLEIELRRKLEGGKLRVPADLIGPPNELGRQTRLVLVHGFNNNDGEAAEAYFGFRTRQKQLFSPSDPLAFDHVFGDTFWPGDADYPSFLDKLDFLVYPVAVHTAIDAGAELANVLARLPNLQRVAFIGHSLGCRVILEALLAVRGRATFVVDHICLMAAAVPSEMLELGGRFYDLLLGLTADRVPILVLHSKEDFVLHFAFPPGQAGAGHDEASNRALGRFGPTPAMPGFNAVLQGNQIAGAKHSDYWGHQTTAASGKATEAAGRFLSLGDVARDVANVRRLATPNTGPDAREIGTARPLG